MMIKNPDAFNRNLACKFNGIFDWDFLKGAFPRKIEPTDWDGVVEINGYFLVFETKEPNKSIPDGQSRAFREAIKTGRFTVIFIWGKTNPIEWERWTRTKNYPKEKCNKKKVFNFVKLWADWADSQKGF